MSGAPGAPATRHAWVDVAKGLGIVLVVLGHTIMGVHDAGKLPAGSGWLALNAAIYSFHMPLFFVLSGLFAPSRLARPASQFAQGLTRQMIWPYLLWALVQALVITAAGSAVNRPGHFDAATLSSLLYLPPAQFWFLYVLVMCLLVSYLLARLRLPASAVVALALLAFCLRPYLHPAPYVIAKFMSMYVFFAFGMAARTWLLETEQTRWQLPAIGAAALAVALSIAATGATQAAPALSVIATLAAAVAGCVLTMALARTAGARVSAPLALLGRESMNIYLLHIFFVAGTRIALIAITRQTDGGAVVVLASMAGVVGPLLTGRLFTRLGMASAVGMLPVGRPTVIKEQSLHLHGAAHTEAHSGSPQK